MKTCFFIGHHDSSEDLYLKLEYEVERHIAEYGVEEFIVGHYGNFDRMAARAVKAAKARHEVLRLTLLLPYLDNRPLPEGFDGSVYPEGLEFVPARFAISQANRITVDRCEYIIEHLNREFGGAWRCLKYAKNRGKHITNIET